MSIQKYLCPLTTPRLGAPGTRSTGAPRGAARGAARIAVGGGEVLRDEREDGLGGGGVHVGVLVPRGRRQAGSRLQRVGGEGLLGPVKKGNEVNITVCHILDTSKN